MNQKPFARILAFVLAVVMVMSVLPVQIFAETTETTQQQETSSSATQATTLPGEETPLQEEAPLPGEGEENEPDQGENDPEGGEEEDIFANVIDVSSAEELELELAMQTRAIRIVSDFEIDRTFYITADTAIYTTEAHTLTRAADFAGDIFVVGENAEGVVCETPVVLTLGHPESAQKDLLTIDGNKANMTVPVTGTVIFVLGKQSVQLYPNLTVTNCKKDRNEKLLTGDYTVSYAENVGGAVAILTGSSSMDIFGGTYSNNDAINITETETGTVETATHGGAFYNYGTLNVYGGTFTNNYATRGGVFYCYRTTRIYNAQILNNSASTYGGAIYMPNSTAAFLFIGGENGVTDSQVTFQGNTATSGGGAIYARNKMEAQDVRFIGNSATTGSGGAVTAGSMQLSFANAVFEGNTAKNYGAAIYYAGGIGKEDVYDLTCTGVTFSNNSTSATGGALYMNGGAIAQMEDVTFNANTAPNNGGAIYLNDGHVAIAGGAFTGNSANVGGAVCLTNSGSFDMDGGSFTENSSVTTGGAIHTTNEASVRLNAVTASKNSAKSGGFVYGEETSSLYIYDSVLQENTTTGNGGAICLYTSAFGGIYNTTFHKNVSGGNGGALFAYTDGYTAGNKLEMNSCTFTQNQGSSGGAIYASQRSVIDLYNSVAKYNSAAKGGFLYHTTTNTIINLASLILEGNTATDGGPIIWGNSTGAILNLDKSLYIDNDYKGEMDDAYWAAAIYNKLKVKEAVLEVPNYIGYDGEEVTPVVPRIPVDITSADELEAALEGGKDLLHITADFTLDRTFYIWRNTTIYTTEAHTLTRAADFGGDIFVVGERTSGEKCENAVTLELGDPESTANNLLTIDGNKVNMTVPVTGTVLFVLGKQSVQLYPNLTVTNCKKDRNEKLLTGDYTVSYAENVGGAVAILTGSSSMDIFGGTYSHNDAINITETETGTVETATYGGAFYNYGTLNVYGGTFTNNYATRGGVFYCYRTTRIYNAQILNNSASTYGGAIYMPNSTAAFLYLGGENEYVQSNVLFQGNTAPSGGAIYAKNKLVAQDVQFISNSATTGSGGAVYTGAMELVLTDTVFDSNTAAKYGAAIYYTGANEKEGVKDLTCVNVAFRSNSVSATGGAIYMNGGAQAYMENVEFTSNSASNNGGAFYLNNGHIVVKGSSFTGNSAAVGGVAALVSGASIEADGTTFTGNTSTGNGGVVSLASASTAVFNRITATENTAKAGGFAYAEEATLTMYRSRIESNTTTSHGGGIYMYTDAAGSIYATEFVDNEVTGSSANGGALALYTGGGEVLVHSCTFTGNIAPNFGGAIWISGKTIAKLYNITARTNSAGYGGFMYHTAAGTVVDLVGVTVSGNTASTGGPIIWGNTYNATLNLDKSKFVDEDHAGAMDSAYWTAAIKNKLTVNDLSAEVPKWLDYQEEAYDHMASAVDVSSAEELEAAINSGAEFIRIIADITVDRTFFIWQHTTIFSTLPRTLTRDPAFAGDFFVVGENAEGVNAVLLGSGAKLTLGNPLSTKENLLTIDGNKDNMTVPVKGSMLFISYSGIAELYTNVTAMNMQKLDNERAYNEKYPLSRPNRIGGTMAVVAGGTLNIYGGNYRNNLVKEEDTSTEEGRNSTIGGLIYNQGNVSIYNGTFENNQSARGGVIYNYRSLKICGGSFIGNVATVSGAVIYSPNAVAAHTHIGSAQADAASVLFRDNHANGNSGGVIYQAALCTLVIYGNTTFEGNTSNGSGGAICAYGSVTIRGTAFTGNSTKSQGGAIYFANSSATYLTRRNLLEDCTFTNNQATHGGAVSLYSSDSEFENGAILEVRDCTFTGNIAAAAASKSTASYGGAFYLERKSSLTLTDSVLTENQARTEGGAIYAGGASTIQVNNTKFTGNAIQTRGKHGGAISLHSVTLNAEGVTFTDNTAVINGGALYVSYSGSYDRNSEVTLKDTEFHTNAAEELGGALYVTKQAVTEEKQIITASNTTFSKNTALSGGAAYVCAGVQVYMTDSTFTRNEATEDGGGAIATSGGILELDTATFTGNTSVGSGAGMYLAGQAQAVLYNITAQNNAAEGNGGFVYGAQSALTMYDSTLQGNTSENNGGGVALYDGMQANIYNTAFTENSSEANGGAVFLYTNLTPCVLHSCTFTGNSGNYGGAVYASGKAVASLYSTVARNNAAVRGGFLYHTTTGTELTLAGVTVSGNTATDGGNTVWGNSTGAVLHLDKSAFTDEDHTGEKDDAYWAATIYNKLTVNDVSVTIPAGEDYESKRETEKPPVTKKPVPVSELFELAKNSSDAAINSTYGAFPRLDNSRNFMSKNVTTFENINGGDVTVDTFVYPAKAAADNCNVGMGLLIWQAMCYKQANPEEEVYIDVSSYRFSVQAAVNINRNSRYFGYMRQLATTVNYDQYGFVRIAYLLICAAKMGIHVNAIGHIDGYPVDGNTLRLNEYFTTQLADPCDPAYVGNGVIGDYLTFTQVEWDLQEKGGADMMHTKLCAVSAYLDMNGVAHENAVFTSSSNLDGIYPKGYNANWKLQTATIVTNHEAIYRTSVNYLRLMPQYQRQEGVYEFQDLVRNRSTQQAQMILAGRENEIPADEQIIYLGRDTDQVFEMYFTPMGGEVLAWNEVQNPYCKYMRKLYDSEDYIWFTWNAAEYSSGFAFGDQLEAMLIAAFHENRNVNNRIYGRMENFDTSTFDDLEVGVDIGYKAFNTLAFNEVHNKDLQFSYVENGQRYYVSLLNSMNFHSGSMYYQSNFALVIKETDCREDSVFFTLADLSTTGIVEHDYGEEQVYMPEDETQDGYTYQKCQQCDKEQITGVVHRPSDWIVDRQATADQDGIRHRECLACGEITDSSTFVYEALDPVQLELSSGRTFTADSRHIIEMSRQVMPATFEATIQIPKSVTGRGGVILSNHEKFDRTTFFLEVYNGGRLRLYFVNEYQYVNHIFSTDIRSDEPKHIALTVNGTTAALYVDGELQETAELALPLPQLHRHLMVGGDYRTGNTQFFKGTIYSVSLFDSVRTPDEIRGDRIIVAADTPSLLYSEVFFAQAQDSTAYTAVSPAAKTFDENTAHPVEDALSSGVKTFEATVLVPKTLSSAGVILGNYGTESGAQMFLDVYDQGRLRLYYTIADGQSAEVILSEDIRSDMPIHIALTINGDTAVTYLNGKAAYTAQLPLPFPELTENFVIGGDNREGNTQFFQGSIYSVNLFDHIRTARDIQRDMLVVSSTEEGLLHSTYFVIDSEACQETDFSSADSVAVEGELSAAPRTFEALIQLPKSEIFRGGVIVGNYNSSLDALINLEIYYNGRVRLFYQRKGGQKASCLFNTDIRSDEAVHIAVTVGEDAATLYVNGEATQTIALTVQYPAATNGFMIGGDSRLANEQYFKGKIYSVSLFDHIRTPEQIRLDMDSVSESAEGLLLTKTFGSATTAPVTTVSGIDGKVFDAETAQPLDAQLPAAPKTIEAIVNVPMDQTDRGGVIVGNYNGTGQPQINLEIYYTGKVRLYLHDGSTKQTVIFQTDVRSDGPVHLAVTLEDALATLYINGEAVETAALSVAVPEATKQFLVGGDHRQGNAQFFKGTIYAVSLFDHVRTPDQIRQDTIFVHADAEGLLYSSLYSTKDDAFTVPDSDGRNFTAETPEKLPETLPAVPKTFEAIVNVPLSMTDRAGVIVGNYNNTDRDQVNLEVYTNGQVRLFLHDGNVKQSVLFQSDIRSDVPVYLAVTLEDALATLYINGEAVETAALSVAVPEATEQFLVGGDHRQGNEQFFKGTVYAVSLFDHVRTPEQIQQDRAFVSGETEGLLYSSTYTTDKTVSSIPVTGGVTFTNERVWDASGSLIAAPQTIEATLRLPKAVSVPGGTIVGNYSDGDGELLNLEVCADGKLRLFSRVADVCAECTFNTDIRSDTAVHIAVTVSNGIAKLYVNGEYTEQMLLSVPAITATDNFRIGGDHRANNTQFFRGTVYSVYLFSTVRTPEQIRQDALSAPAESDELVLSKVFADGVCQENATGFDHVEGEWILDRGATENDNGLMHSDCTLCGKTLRVSQVSMNADNAFWLDTESVTGLQPSAPRLALTEALRAMPKTFAFTLQLPKSVTTRGGVVFGNYNGGSGNFLNIEIYTNGQPRLWFKIGEMPHYYLFKTDVRSEEPVHLALTVDGVTASLYINGVLKETATLTAQIPETLSNYYIGSDNRLDNTQPFKGTIYGVNLFDHVRTPEQIAVDALLVSPNEAGLIVSHYFRNETLTEPA